MEVQQDLFVVNATITENVPYGLDRDSIVLNSLRKSVKEKPEISGFIFFIFLPKFHTEKKTLPFSTLNDQV
ncbi:hypothetical protein IQ37_11900 [Chryseobacterium piperi]|uniref:Uncharacterized protein n=1 Tax=Chryseobacterium piperi TaxID=558152 RepID=A0A086BB25_9FLAO|nr:hypothetical protein IQ37_11900 [Chryseobacterium piperi]